MRLQIKGARLEFIELYVTSLRCSTLTPNPSPEGRGERRAKPDVSSGFVMINNWVTRELDHFIVPCRDQVASAKRLAELLGVKWAEKGAGPFSPVHVNDELTLDFIQTDEAFPIHHYCFRVSEAEFDAIFGRIKAAGIPLLE